MTALTKEISVDFCTERPISEETKVGVSSSYATLTDTPVFTTPNREEL